MAVLAAILTMIRVIAFAIIAASLITGAIVVICFVIGCLIGLIKDHEMEDDEWEE